MPANMLTEGKISNLLILPKIGLFSLLDPFKAYMSAARRHCFVLPKLVPSARMAPKVYNVPSLAAAEDIFRPSVESAFSC